MREIKYRGKRQDNGNWVYGYLARYMDNETLCISDRQYFATRDFGDEEDDEPKLEDGYALGEFHSVINSTVGQFTGFFDNKGKEIYEGDIVNDGLGVILWCEKTGMFRVKWYHPTWVSIRGSNSNYNVNGEPLLLNSHIVWEVIGNVHENLELDYGKEI